MNQQVVFMCLTPQVYLFIRRLSKTSPLTGPGSFFAAGSNVFTTVTSPMTMLVQRIPRRHSITPTLNATITAAPLMEVDEKVESQVDVCSEETPSTDTLENVADVDQESTCPTTSLQATVGIMKDSTCPTKSLQPEVGIA